MADNRQHKDLASVQRLDGGMMTDSSILTQNQETMLFMLNGTEETKEGDLNSISNYPSNELCGDIYKEITKDTIILGHKYMANGEVALIMKDLSINKDTIAVFDTKTCSLQDNKLVADLNLSVEHQIDIAYRLRRGCERVIYFTDNYNPPRYYNFDRPEIFNDKYGNFDRTLMNLINTRYSIPKFSDISVKEEGNILPGSVVIGFQYVDNDQNVSHIITLSKKVEIYNDFLENGYYNINGTSSKDDIASTTYRTSKSINISLEDSTLDRNYSFYRLVFIHYNSGDNTISKVYQSDNIPITKRTYLYTGEKDLQEIDRLELQQEPILIATAKNILTKDDRLHLANTTENFINYCQLQKYASKIKSFCTVEKYAIADLNSKFCPKKPNHLTGYMPGDIYSFGIVYIFDNGLRTPVYHIPGRTEKAPIKDFQGEAYQMSLDNETQNTTYSTYVRNSCLEDDFWGTDYNGKKLINKNVRHHRFPTREELGIDFITQSSKDSFNYKFNYYIKIIIDSNYESSSILNNIKDWTSIEITDRFSDNSIKTTTISKDDRDIKESDGVYSFEKEIVIDVDQKTFSKEYETSTITLNLPDSKFTLVDNIFISPNREEVNFKDDEDNNIQGSTYTVARVVNEIESSVITNVEATALGIIFSNIQLPNIKTIDGSKIVGYEIVRQERTEQDRNILDTGFLTPGMTDNENYYSVGLWNVDYGIKSASDSSVRSDDVKIYNSDKKFERLEDVGMTNAVYGLWHPLFHYQDKEFLSTTTLKSLGTFTREDGPLKDNYLVYRGLNPKAGASGPIHNVARTYLRDTDNSFEKTYEGEYFDAGFIQTRGYIEDIKDGTTYDASVHSKKEEDEDGLDLFFIARESQVKYLNTDIFDECSCKINYLNALSSILVDLDDKEKSKTLINITSDSKQGFVIPNERSFIDLKDFYRTIPYVALHRENKNFYSNFRESPYYKETNNHFDFSSPITHTTPIYSGDIHIGEVRPQHSVYIGTAAKERSKKKNWWRWVLGGLLVVAGIIASIFTGGLSAGASATISGSLIGAGLAVTSKALKIHELLKAYSEAWQKGVLESLCDNLVASSFGLGSYKYKEDKNLVPYPGVYDDELRYLVDGVNILYYETTINTNLRHKVKEDLTTILNSNSTKEEVYSYALNKLTSFDQIRKEFRTFRGIPFPEMYLYNEDYNPTNYGKIKFALPETYDCCSKCMEKFPHRIYYSEQSFAEELSDNFKIIKPNNYRDIPGETGEITNLFTLQNTIHAHTEESLWKIPTNFQERVSTDLVSYIGTGEYLAIPPQQVIDDDNGNTFGLKHKWSTTVFPNGYLFVCEQQRKIILYDGQFNDLTKFGYSKWFYRHIPQEEFEDNPANPNSGGFISCYFPKEEKLFITKKVLNKGSWTISYHIPKKVWRSFHSFIPSVYINSHDLLFSWKNNIAGIWKHDVKGKYCKYYNIKYPFIIEYVTTKNMILNHVYDYFRFYTEAFIFNGNYFEPVKNITFNKALLTTDQHSSGWLTLLVPDLENQSYFDLQSFDRLANEIHLNKKETDWYFNEIRNYRLDYDESIYLSSDDPMQEFIHNDSIIDFNQEWQDIDMLSGKYLKVRLVFENKEDYKLIQHFINLNMSYSLR